MPESLPPNAPRGPSPIKRALVDAGFEIFRTRGDEIVLAERPRENLIMDSGVRLRVTEPLEVRVVFRAQKADFPAEDEALLFERVRKLAEGTLTGDFAEVETGVTRVADPGDAERTLDTFYEVTYSRPFGDLTDAIVELKRVFSVEKRA